MKPVTQELFSAVEVGDGLQAAECLKRGADVNGTKPSKKLPLHISASRGDLTLMGHLINSGGYINKGDRIGNTPVHEAALSQQWAAMELLVEKGGQIQLQNLDGQTPIQAAYSTGNFSSETEQLIKDATSRYEKFQDTSPVVSSEQDFPLWVPDHLSAGCMICSRDFSIHFRRHHCRHCGILVCGYCSSQRVTIFNWAVEPLRVCDACFNSLLNEGDLRPAPTKETSPRPRALRLCSFAPTEGTDSLKIKTVRLGEVTEAPAPDRSSTSTNGTNGTNGSLESSIKKTEWSREEDEMDNSTPSSQLITDVQEGNSISDNRDLTAKSATSSRCSSKNGDSDEEDDPTPHRMTKCQSDDVSSVGLDIVDISCQGHSLLPTFLLTDEVVGMKSLLAGNNHLTTAPAWIERLGRLEVLDLSYNEIDILPPNIGNMNMLRQLNVRTNQLCSLPVTIGQLSTLETLDCQINQLDSFPDSICGLNGLRSLNAYGNQIKCLPCDLSGLSNLEVLDMHINKLRSLPPSFGVHLTSLKELRLGTNNLRELPDSIGSLSKLELLDLRSNLISLPDTVSHLKSLKTLNLYGNKLSVVPLCIEKLAALEELIIDMNHVEVLPDWMGNLAKLMLLSFAHNRVSSLPDTLGRISTLANLNMSYNPVEHIPSVVLKLPYLSKINSQGCPIQHKVSGGEGGIEENFRSKLIFKVSTDRSSVSVDNSESRRSTLSDFVFEEDDENFAEADKNG